MPEKSECIDFEKLKALPVIVGGIVEEFGWRYLVHDNNPPDFPMRWARSLPGTGIWGIQDEEGVWHLVDLMDAFEIRKPLPLDHPEVRAYVKHMLDKHRDVFVHPSFGLICLGFYDRDVVRYDATDSPKSSTPIPTKEEALPFCTPENAYSTQLIRRYYPTYNP